MQKEEEDNIQEIAESIFTKPPGAPNSIQLQLEEMTAEIADKEGVENFIFNILCLITYKGVEMLFGHNKIHELSQKQFNLLTEYVRSYGYDLVVHANNSSETPWELVKNGERLTSYQISFEKYKIV